MIGLADLVKLCEYRSKIFTFFQTCDLKETVKIQFFQVMVLGNDAADETNEFIAVLNALVFHVDETNLVVQLIHMLGALVQINDISLGSLDRIVYLC